MKRLNAILTILVLVIVAGAASAAPPEGDGFYSIRVTPKGYMTNSLLINNSSGTAMLTITKDGVTTFAGAQTFSAGVTFDSTSTWGAAGTINFDGTTIDLDPTSTFDLEMAAAKVAGIDLADNLTAALAITEAAVPYIVINTNTGTESIVFGGTADDPDYTFAGTGTMSLAGGFDGAGIGDFAGTLTCSKGTGTALDVSSGGELNIDGTLDVNGTSDFGATATFSKGSGDAVDIASGGALNIDGTVDCNGAADFADNVLFSGTSKTVSFASNVDANAGLAADGAAITLNHSSNFTVGIGTGTTTAAVTIGGGSNTVAIASSALDVSTTGAVSGVTTLAASDTVTLSKASGTALSVADGGLSALLGNVDLGTAASNTISFVGSPDTDITAAAAISGGWDISMAQAATGAASVAINLVSGEGGDGSSAIAGAGGDVNIGGGDPGSTDTGQDGADGGSVLIAGADGADLDGGGSNDGSGGSITLTPGASSGTGTGAEGRIVLNDDVVMTDIAVAAGGNTACNTTCGNKACWFGFDAGTTALVDCASALADTCVCVGN